MEATEVFFSLRERKLVMQRRGVISKGKTKLLYLTIAPVKGIVYPDSNMIDIEKNNENKTTGFNLTFFNDWTIEMNNKKSRKMISITAGIKLKFLISFGWGRRKAISTALGIKKTKLIKFGSNCGIVTFEPPSKSKNSFRLLVI